MEITRNHVLKLLGVAGGGIVGSAAWEGAKPFLSKGWDLLLTVATLGIDTLRDAIYADARFSLEVANAEYIKVVGMACPLLILTVVVAVGLHTWPQHNGNLNFRKRARYFALCTNVVVMLSLVQLAEQKYVIGLTQYRLEVETLAAVSRSDQDIRVTAAKLVQIRTRDQFVGYVEDCRKEIEQRGGRAPTRDLF